jgi:hypothetical protein
MEDNDNMKKQNKKYAIVVSLMLMVGAVAAALPLLVEAAVSVSDSGTAEPMWFPELTNNTGQQYINASSAFLNITNSGDTVNGNKTDQVAGNKWINITFRSTEAWFPVNLWLASGNKTIAPERMKVWASINGGPWHDCGEDIWNPSDPSGDELTVFITDADWDYTFSSGDYMLVKLQFDIDTDAAPATGTYSTAVSNTSELKWSIEGYS